MGRPKVFLQLFDDLVAKRKSKAAAEKEYKTYMLMAKEGLRKDCKLSDIKPEPRPHDNNPQPSKKQRMVDTGGVSSSEKEFYERLVEAERLRAESEKQRGDDLSKIAMMLASGKGDGATVVPQSPAKTSSEQTPVQDTTEKTTTEKKTTGQKTGGKKV